MTTIELAGKFWRVDPEAFVAYYESKPPIGRVFFALGCTECLEICTIARRCRCCANIGTKAGGTGRLVRGIQNVHDRFPIDEVLERLRRAV